MAVTTARGSAPTRGSYGIRSAVATSDAHETPTIIAWDATTAIAPLAGAASSVPISAWPRRPSA